jgi:hypothetical protein
MKQLILTLALLAGAAYMDHSNRSRVARQLTRELIDRVRYPARVQ